MPPTRKKLRLNRPHLLGRGEQHLAKGALDGGLVGQRLLIDPMQPDQEVEQRAVALDRLAGPAALEPLAVPQIAGPAELLAAASVGVVEHQQSFPAFAPFSCDGATVTRRWKNPTVTPVMTVGFSLGVYQHRRKTICDGDATVKSGHRHTLVPGLLVLSTLSPLTSCRVFGLV